ncbi:recombinase family protein [Thalassotalea fonticola]|uniref:Recombinase family protein n=1 Tax=Thalassotalea fonticola TaxID=3065649 RepID=A0ABZ0GRJ7_9GAMM|nr:recombinase family protein [Colwelliaceae bacterium S1-1]
MLYIYARTSTVEQNVQQQVNYLEGKYKVDGVYSDQQTGKTLDRPEFIKLKAVVKCGDSIVVQDLSRIGRNTTEVLEFVDEMVGKGVGIKIDDLGEIDITSSAGKMVLTTLAAVATMQREQMLEKQAIGIATARAEGKYRGKQQSQATIDKCKQAISLIEGMGYSKEKAAKASGVGVATLYRYIKTS